MSPVKGNPRLCTHDELPAWCKDNAFIVTGYRRPGLEGSEKPHELHSEATGKNAGLATEINGQANLRSRKPGPKDSVAPAATPATTFQHDSVWKCWRSIWCYAHNETVNIHTHLWGALSAVAFLGLHLMHHFGTLPTWIRPLSHHSLFLPSIITRAEATSDYLDAHLPGFHLPSAETAYTYVDYARNDWRDTAGFGCFLIAGILCLGLSSSFHTVACHSRTLAKRFNSLDYLGIVIMIVGSFLPALHYGFYCHTNWQIFYAVCITTLGSAAAATVIAPRYATPAFRPWRTAIFLTLGLSAVVPVAHGSYLYGHAVLNLTMGLDYLVASGALYVVGALLYALRVPERFAPGKFDYFGASHQIFHTFILLAAFSHYICLRRAYTFWHTVQVLDNASGTGAGKELVCRALDAWRTAS